ncbi:MAG: hypothetical protein DI563_02550 [Variovorax paradoxus]|uniref:Uncharacterized protein n=1 Tax=Variovorax paradoxus TaxID=34073 RepID=A0A2W5QGX6_VARPD|nr:MAG: hypothetical protein DI563_02550 [Variovorax paradoxus]
MKPACIDAVTEAVGRVMSDAEIKGIEDRISRELRGIQDGPDGLRLTGEQRFFEAARRARESFLADQDLKARRDALAVVKQAQLQQALDGFAGDKIAGLRRLLAFHADGKGSVLSVESRAEAIEADAFRQMLGTLEASNPKFFGLLENPEGVRALVRELFGEDSGVREAKEGAAQFHKVAAELLSRFNDGGGKVRAREDWGLPHHHSQRRIAAAGESTWIDSTFPKLNRDRYRNEDGSRMNDGQVTTFLREAYQTLATGGVNNLEPGARGAEAMRANYHAAAREIHFKNADDYLAYQADFGERGLYEVLTGHIRAMADSIAMVETFGPNPDHAYRYFRDLAEREQTVADPTKRGKIAKQLVGLDNLFDYVSGKTLPVANEHLASAFDTVRKWLVASRLGSAFISSLPDEATMQLTARVNNLDGMQMIRNELAALNPANQMEKRLAQRAGLALQTMIGGLTRFGDESMRNTLATKLATFTMRASGLSAITDARRRAFGTVMMSSLGHLSREVDTPSKLDPQDHRLLLSKGITDADWQVWKRAELEDWGSGNNTMLTPESIYRIPNEALAGIGDIDANPQQLRRDAATRLLGVVLEEQNMAVVEPGGRERAALYSNLQRGTWKGELTRSVFLFKTMPIAMLMRHWERGMSGPDARSKAGYIAALTVSTTLMGMLALQIDELLKGRDPVNMNPFEGKAGARNWVRAFLKGGSLGIYGDFLFAEQTQGGQSPVASALGPVVGAAEEVFGLTQGNVVQALQGKNTHAGAELVKFAKGMTPMANLWYTKAVTDHLIFNQLQELVSPGYLARMRQRAQREFGQSFYWEPQDAAPQRAPNLAAGVGQ